MWDLDNKTPFEADRSWVRDRDGADVWIVAVTASFRVDDDGLQQLDPNPAPVHRALSFHGDPATTGLSHETDFVIGKRATDVLVDGHAYAPEGQPVAQLDIRLRVGPIDKRLRVHGDRRYRFGLGGSQPGPATPFTQIPIVYERAFGGTHPTTTAGHPQNPVGVGFADNRESLVGHPAPNIEPIGGNPRRAAGLGPIARHWSPRRDYAGTYDAQWKAHRCPLEPWDLDDRFHQCAPADQQVEGFLRGGETVELHHLTPDRVLRFDLPRLRFQLTTRFAGGTTRTHDAVLHTLHLRPDTRSFSMTYHSRLDCHRDMHHLERTRIGLKRRVGVPTHEFQSGMWMPPGSQP
ncbi:MAG: DUF2169 domain-containing protein [Deltaproteobacteria bacterium]|nr:DUF2169 domain-containing protein [Deltaproteobacteria bacterium]